MPRRQTRERMTRFKEINSRLDLPKQELEILHFWDKENIFQKSIDARKGAERFVFFEGPPTANAKPGLHHLIARYFKDLWPRFKTMQGFLVERKAGWDTHGLPVELAIEKELGLDSKQDIEKYGVAKFNRKAKEDVWKYKELWEKLTVRSAFWLDLDNYYMSHDPKYIESLWWIVKQIWDKDLLYQGYRVALYCPRCGTTLSSHEVAQGYEEVEEDSVYVKFKLKDEKNTYVLAWTTTPWTLPGNVALAVGEEIDYVVVESNKEKLILAKDLVEKVLGDKVKVIKKMKGKELIGKEYESLFPGVIDPEGKKSWYIVSADFVTTEDGTGVVHTAVMYGEDDYKVGLEYDLPAVHTVSKEGTFLPSVKQWAGRFVKDPEVEKEIVADLEGRGLLFSKILYKHDYPFCWRCKSPLLYYATNSWFIKMSALQDQLIRNNKEINWIPKHLQEGRFGEWLRGVKDWAISRNRYWGTPLPIWQNKDGDIICIGSYEELRKLAKNKLDADFDPHKPDVDKIVLIKDGKEYKRVPEVMDTWFDSGSMPFAQWHYPFENKERIDKSLSFPADFIAEAVDQTRGWFYTLLAVSTLLDKGAPYKNVISIGHVLDKHGKKMSKSVGNVIDPWKIFDQYGSDALRWYFYTVNQPGLSKNFDENILKQITRRFILTLWNTTSFFTTYANLDDFKPTDKASKSTNILDKWIVARLNQVVESTTNSLEGYDALAAALEIEKLVDDLSNWYIRRSRKRFWRSENNKDKLQAYQTLYWVLKNISLLLAPFMPFVAEAIYSALKDKKDPVSVHLHKWPKAGKIDDKLIENMFRTRKLVEIGHHLREQAKIKVRQPLNEFVVAGKSLDDDLVGLMLNELNIKKVTFKAKIKQDKLDIKITPKLEIEGLAREIVRAVQALRKNTGLQISDRIKIFYSDNDELINKTFTEFAKYIKGEVLSVEIVCDNQKADSEISANGHKFKVGLKKI